MISVVFALHDACISERSTNNTYAGAYTTRKQIIL